MKIIGIIGLTIIIYIFMYMGYNARLKYNKLQVIYIHISKISQIRLLKNNLVKPIIYTSVVSLKELPVLQKKKTFISLILPSILLVKQDIDTKRNRVKNIYTKYIQNKSDKIFLGKLMQQYHAKDAKNLLKKMVMPPNDLIIAQAALESGWGTSRFFVKANNIFGVWAYNPKDKTIEASRTRDGRIIHVRKYISIQQSIHDYLLMLSSSKHYQNFRQMLQKTKNPYQLADELQLYSELRGTYTERLKQVIKQNDLIRYDNYHLN